MIYISVILSAVLFVGCTNQEVPNPPKKEAIQDKSKIIIEDLVTVPQDVSYYTSKLNDVELYEIQKNYEQHYFSVWNITEPSKTLEEIQWPFKAFSASKSYGENLRLVDENFFEEMKEASNFDAYGTMNLQALTIKHANMRAMPTNKPLLRDPSIAGEGFPFDYLQNSSVNANTPLFISHYSKDKQWVFAFSSFAYGWIHISDIAFIDENYTQIWKNAQQVNITQEGISLFTENGDALYDTRIGMRFALIGEDEQTYTILTVSKYKNNNAMYHKTKITKDIASKEILNFNKENLEKVMSQIAKSNYGWGGVYGERDCSSTLMDLYTPFGIWLPRNSSKQSEVGEVLNLTKLSDEDKIAFIKEEGMPFQTLLYRKGHIVLYVGTYNDEIVVFQNVWGIRTKKENQEGRFLIGKTVFTTLRFGEELEDYDKSAELLKNIERMNTLTR